VKRFFPLCLLLTCLPLIPCGAQTFSIELVEDSKGIEAPDLSNAVLEGSLEVLFNSGLIATNESIGRVEKTAFQSAEYGLASARDGLVEYLAIVWIRYSASGEDPIVPVPETVLWRLVRVRDGTVFGKGTAKPPVIEKADAKITMEDRQRTMAELGKSLANLWLELLAKDRG
jgi:hypothetical protein